MKIPYLLFSTQPIIHGVAVLPTTCFVEFISTIADSLFEIGFEQGIFRQLVPVLDAGGGWMRCSHSDLQ